MARRAAELDESQLNIAVNAAPPILSRDQRERFARDFQRSVAFQSPQHDFQRSGTLIPKPNFAPES
jgi:hypothetical protein